MARDFFLITENTLPYYVTLRSTAINITSSGRFDNNEYFNEPLIVEFMINSIKKHETPISDMSVKFFF